MEKYDDLFFAADGPGKLDPSTLQKISHHIFSY
jgi:hypothetical protein